MICSQPVRATAAGNSHVRHHRLYRRHSAAPLVCSGLSFLQHRGQDSAGVATMDGDKLLVEKGVGLARDVFDLHKISALHGQAGIGHVRYSTSGSACALSEIQPFYVNQPYGITLAHNGNLVNQQTLCHYLAKEARHINTDSDSEALLNVLAQAIYERVRSGGVPPRRCWMRWMMCAPSALAPCRGGAHCRFGRAGVPR